MPDYRFMLSNTAEVREAGVIRSETFTMALNAINEQITAHVGDTLEVGVTGFPPARFECVWSGETGMARWRPTATPALRIAA